MYQSESRRWALQPSGSLPPGGNRQPPRRGPAACWARCISADVSGDAWGMASFFGLLTANFSGSPSKAGGYFGPAIWCGLAIPGLATRTPGRLGSAVLEYLPIARVILFEGASTLGLALGLCSVSLVVICRLMLTASWFNVAAHRQENE